MSTPATEGIKTKATIRLPARCGAAGGPSRKATKVLDVTVLMGGPSTEREVSIVSGSAVADALERLGHKVARCDITPQDTSALDRQGADVVFIAMHGKFGESGEVQELCEQRGLRYTGCGPVASRLGIDKAASKAAWRKAGIVTADWAIIEKSHTPALRAKLLSTLPLPVVVKPFDGGSSVDLTIARDAASRDAAIDDLLAKYGLAMVEQFIQGRELTVGIIGEMVLPIIHIVPAREFYDFTAKYADDAGTEYRFDHGLGDALAHKIQQAALAAYQCLGGRDMSRVDFILDSRGVPYVLEINTIPGFTSHSLLPKAAAKAGVSFDQLVERIVMMAMQRG